jgi:hypothetical protein
VWTILRRLSDDPEPSREYENRYGGPNMDALTVSINTVRGEAMHAVVRYGLWAQRHLRAPQEPSLAVQPSLDAMPEVREVLEAHLDVQREPSLAIRAVYGQWLPWLVALDSEWTRGNLARILPVEAGLHDWRDAAWDTYILGPAYDNLLEILGEEYRRAVTRIGATRQARHRLADPDQRLADHLMLFYGRGKIGLDDNGLLHLFYSRASDSLRAHALSSVGRGLRQAREELPAALIDRLTALWEARLRAAQAARTPETFREELAAFGWWFASGKFGAAWCLDQLDSVLKLIRKLEPPYLVYIVIQTLAALVSPLPGQALACLRLLVEGNPNDINLVGLGPELRTILTAGLDSQNADTVASAKSLVNYLAACGRSEFLQLLRRDR